MTSENYNHLAWSSDAKHLLATGIPNDYGWPMTIYLMPDLDLRTNIMYCYGYESESGGSLVNIDDRDALSQL